MQITRFICRLALPVGIILGVLGTANAAVSDAARQACTPDAMRLCSEFIPDAAKVKTCMLRKRAQLSQACRTAMRGGNTRTRREHHHRSEHHVHHYRHHHR